MNVYIHYREYHNGVGVIDDVFSSEAKAKADEAFVKECCDKDGWSITEAYRWMRGQKLYGFKIVPPSGNMENSEFHCWIKEKVR